MLFDGPTFVDPTTGKLSWVRRSLTWILLFAAALILLAVAMFGLVEPAAAKEISAFVVKICGVIAGIVIAGYGAMQAAKGYAQGQAAKSATTSTTTAMATHPIAREALSVAHRSLVTTGSMIRATAPTTVGASGKLHPPLAPTPFAGPPPGERPATAKTATATEQPTKGGAA